MRAHKPAVCRTSSIGKLNFIAPQNTRQHTNEMRTSLPVNSDFVEGFVKQCVDQGMSEEQTEDLYKVFANNSIINSPNVRAGFVETLANYRGPLTKEAMTKYMTPEIISLVEDCRVKAGSDVMSKQMRATMGMAEPESNPAVHEALEVNSNVFAKYAGLSPSEQILISMLIGGGLGSTLRAVAPTEVDKAKDRGTATRMLRGAIAGLGGGLGAHAGRLTADTVNPSGSRFSPGRMAGGIAGGIVGNDFVESILDK